MQHLQQFSFFHAAYLERPGMADVVHEVSCDECSRIVEVNESVLKNCPKLRKIRELVGYGGCILYEGSCYALHRVTP